MDDEVKQTGNPHKQRRIPLERNTQAVYGMMKDNFDNAEPP